MVGEYFQTDLTNLKKRLFLLPNPRAGPRIKSDGIIVFLHNLLIMKG